MKKYRASIEGRNFLTNSENKTNKLGFFTTRHVEAINKEQAELLAIELIKNDNVLAPVVINPEENPPLIFVTELDELENDKGANPPGGYTFFLDKK